MFRRALLIATFITAGMVLPVEAQVATKVHIVMEGGGSITYNPQLFERPDIARLTALRLLVNDFVYEKCTSRPENSCSPINIERPSIHVAVLPYAEFEKLVVGWFEKDHPEYLDGLLGDGILLSGLTFRRLAEPDARLYYYQMPSDELWVHELMHVIFPYDEEEDVNNKVTQVLSGHEYKDWMRENY